MYIKKGNKSKLYLFILEGNLNYHCSQYLKLNVYFSTLFKYTQH